MYRLKVILFYRLPGFIFLLVLSCGYASAQNNNVTVDGTVNVNGNVEVTNPVKMDAGGSAEGSTDITSDMNFRESVDGREPVQGIASSTDWRGTPWDYLFGDPREWYTPNYFTWQKWNLYDDKEILWASNFGSYNYHFNKRWQAYFIFPVPDTSAMYDALSYNYFGISDGNFFSKWKTFFWYRGNYAVTWQSQNYMPNGYGEQNFRGEFNFYQLLYSSTWNRFLMFAHNFISVIYAIGFLFLDYKIITTW